MLPDAETLYAALVARDDRFAGLAFVCVKTTAIYCRFGCPARTPLRRNVTFLATTAECEAAGFRACKRCRPEEVRPSSLSREAVPSLLHSPSLTP
ncbi:Ada metal-binding domain-containing protein [Tabrizicola sp.]|uniref:Ada metal-binding domain-containing protein n=1 Tax=Tabrizicola sp. TaxID=2005166 RepID=UPI003F37551B